MIAFRGNKYFLSNFYPCLVKYKGRMFGSSEAAYAAEKCANESDKDKFIDLNPGKAKRLGRKIKIRDDWENIKLQVMEDIVRAKFKQNPNLMKLLVAVKGDIVEYNEWGDTFWGVCDNVGENHLGKILMKIRESEI